MEGITLQLRLDGNAECSQTNYWPLLKSKSRQLKRMIACNQSTGFDEEVWLFTHGYIKLERKVKIS